MMINHSNNEIGVQSDQEHKNSLKYLIFELKIAINKFHH